MSYGFNLLPGISSTSSSQLPVSQASLLPSLSVAGRYRICSTTRARISVKTRCSHVPQLRKKAAVHEVKETEEVSEVDEIKQKTEVVREILQSIDDGNLSVSAYDTAWVALVKDRNESGVPQFPSSLEWIINNQLLDGSWGDRHFFSTFDRLSSTLACVVALATWNLSPEKCERGVNFLRQNMYKLKDEDPEHIPSGFEVRFPSLLKMAENLGLEISQDSTLLQHLHTLRAEKLKRIPMEMLHSVPTTLLYSLEGMPDLDWERLLKLQHPNGSFLCSTGSTAYALDQSKDEKCYEYIEKVVKTFNGGVPHSYPVDLFERLWVVDRLERLGISRYFKAEIKECLDHVYRHWTPNGISWSSGTVELDIDDTSMGLRILRLHGYEIDANAYRHFERDGKFYCFVGQTSQGVTEMLSLYRASQILFPGEQIIKEAKEFSSKYIREKYELGQVADRWLITKHLLGEVQYYLDVPWYASLPRLETRHYIELYGGDEDAWIGKVLYRMYNVSNNHYLDLAKLDYNHCQKLHQKEWASIEMWYNKHNLGDFGLRHDKLLKVYFLAMSSIFEPERQQERLAWSYTIALTETISSNFKSISIQLKQDFIHTFENSDFLTNNRRMSLKGTGNKLINTIIDTMSDISLMVWEVHGKEVQRDLKSIWDAWMLSYKSQEDEQDEQIILTEAGLLVSTLNLCAGHSLSEALLSPDYVHLVNLVNKIGHQTQKIKKCTGKTAFQLTAESVDLEMQELVQQVLTKSEGTKGINPEMKQTFLHVAKSYYYTACCESTTMNSHIAKVLFDQVI